MTTPVLLVQFEPMTVSISVMYEHFLTRWTHSSDI